MYTNINIVRTPPTKISIFTNSDLLPLSAPAPTQPTGGTIGGTTGGTIAPPINSYQTTVNNASLINQKVIIRHGLNTLNPVAQIYNNLNQNVEPSDLVVIDSQNVQISFEGYTPLSGTWNLKII